MRKPLLLLPVAFAAALLVNGRWDARRGLGQRPARAADPDPCAAPPAPDYSQLAAWLAADCYKRPALGYVRDKEEKRKVGPTLGTAPHGRVTVYYSPQVVAWLK